MTADFLTGWRYGYGLADGLILVVFFSEGILILHVSFSFSFHFLRCALK
jgi:hypothetical protein